MNSWVVRTNAAAAALLMVFAATCALLSRSAPDIYLKFYVNETSVFSSHLGNRFGLNYLFTITLSVAAAIHIYHACRPACLVDALRKTRSRPLRIVYLYAVLPAIHACVLVGVAKVQDAWCVIAAVLLMIEIVTHLWVVDVKQHKSVAAALATGLNLMLYVAFWMLVWIASTRENVVALALFCATIILTIILHVYIGFCLNSSRWTQDVVREIVFVACLVGIQLLCIVGWTVSHPSLSDRITRAVAGAVSGLYVVFVTYLVATAPTKYDEPCELLDNTSQGESESDSEDDILNESNVPNLITTS